uniref:Saposin B-type domain-containing protein n=1 Tax=Schistosoma japonicum TaxID=6182 RepID=Q5BZU4_SCHJA|nr:unknown [Schistosoma japonicum]
MTWECEICLSGFSFIRFLMNDSYLRDFNMFATKKICERIPPGRSKNVCVNFVTKYLPKILDEIGSAAKPEELCKDLEACNSTEVMLHTIKRNNVIDFSNGKQFYQLPGINELIGKVEAAVLNRLYQIKLLDVLIRGVK